MCRSGLNRSKPRFPGQVLAFFTIGHLIQVTFQLNLTFLSDKSLNLRRAEYFFHVLATQLIKHTRRDNGMQLGNPFVTLTLAREPHFSPLC